MNRTLFNRMVSSMIARRVLVEEERPIMLEAYSGGFRPHQYTVVDASITPTVVSGFYLELTSGGKRIARPLLSPNVKLSQQLVKDYQWRATGLSNSLYTTGNTSSYAKSMMKANREFTLKQAIIGKGNMLDPSERLVLQLRFEKQVGYLERFVQDIEARNTVGRKYSRKYTANRAKMYAGEHYAEFWRGAVKRLPINYLVYYDSVDARGTCGPCLSAEMGSPYKPNDHPYPGNVCLGGGLCRCKLRFEHQ